jgi:hypothetical protein
MRRHRAELAYAAGELWARCRCGWIGAAHNVADGRHGLAYQAAEREAREHEQAERVNDHGDGKKGQARRA